MEKTFLTMEKGEQMSTKKPEEVTVKAVVV